MAYFYQKLFLSLPCSNGFLSLHFNGDFPGGPGLAGTRMSSFWILLELSVMDMVVTTATTRRAKLQSKCHQQQTNTQFFLKARCPAGRPTNSGTQSTERKFQPPSMQKYQKPVERI